MIEEKINEDLKAAMLNVEPLNVEVLRCIKSAISLHVTKSGNKAILDEDVINIIKKQKKQREESAEIYKFANRSDLEAKERAEIVVLEKYLPSYLTGGELQSLVDDVFVILKPTKTDFKKIIDMVNNQAIEEGYTVDNKEVAEAIKNRL